ncbi:MAG: histidine kinase [Bryobacterales bacterium]|nr:histidine kinase [Bryobacterales bacterium]
MPEILTLHEPLLVNTLGHSIGALLFGIFVFLLLRDRSRSLLRESHLSIAAGTMAFGWNFTALLILAVPRTDVWISRLVPFTAMACLSFLPAVLLHLSLGPRFRVTIIAGYLLSIGGVVLNGIGLLVNSTRYHNAALVILSAGFCVLTVLSAAMVFRSSHKDHQPPFSRIIGALSLFLLSLSFVHYGTGAVNFWPLELAMHHAGIPLALFVLLQDFRFVLLDAFIRFTANMVLAAGFTVVGLQLGEKLAEIPVVVNEILAQALLLMIACFLLILFAVLRHWVQHFLTLLVFGRADIEQTLQQLRAKGASTTDESQFVEWSVARLAAFMKAEQGRSAPAWMLDRLRAQGLLQPLLVERMADLRDELVREGAEVIVPVRISHDEIRFLLLGRRAGGRPYLSEDLEALGRLGAEIAEHIERLREAEMRRLVSQAELRALQSQIHPHFLFNALNTLYGVIPKSAAGARHTVLNLADIFRYFLESERPFIALEEEIHIIKAYLEIEGLRLGPKLKTEISIQPDVARVSIPILTIQPLVENAVKHGIATRPDGGLVKLEVERKDDSVLICVSDTGGGFPASEHRRGGVGLDNVLRRLNLCYGPGAGLDIRSNQFGARVSFQVPLALQQETGV